MEISTMSDKADYKAPNPAPMYILLTFSICLCAYFFFIGTVCARLWFYKGALGPIPEVNNTTRLRNTH